jgi:hypothetical protein
VKSKEVKTGSNLAQFSKEGYGSKCCFTSDDDDLNMTGMEEIYRTIQKKMGKT